MKNTKIEWTDNTVNFWHGCNKVSPGCKYCYMFRDKNRYGQDPNIVKRASDKTFYQALKWNSPKRIFTCSWSDFFIEDADSWREDAWEVIKKTPQHEWQILTKRVENIRSRLPQDWGPTGYKNVLLGVSIENQKYVNRMVDLVSLKGPSAQFRTFLSLEPLLGPINLIKTQIFENAFRKIDWVIVGGESGNDSGKFRYRPSEIRWYEDIVNLCKNYSIPVFVKQLGTFQHHQMNLSDRLGGNIKEFPKVLQVREFPKRLAMPVF